MLQIFAFIIAYAIGIFPTGQILAKIKGIDLSSSGSGNVGATNAGRVLGIRAGVLTLVGDMLKGYLAVLVTALCFGDQILTAIAGVAVVLGHCFSIPGKLKGGKGVATALGVITFLSPECSALSIAVFVPVLAIFKMVSLASVCASVSAPIWGLLIQVADPFCYCLMSIALVIVARHRSNLKRIVEGAEPRIGKI